MAATNPIERALEQFLFWSRWLMAPFYVGLVIALFALLVSFAQAIWETLPHLFELHESGILLWVLTLIDLSLTANLLLMVIFSGYENFVSRMHSEQDHPDRPAWMGTIDFSGMKLKLVASIVAISAIQLLRAFMSIDTIDKDNLAWMIGIHVTFVVSGLLLATMDFISERSAKH